MKRYSFNSFLVDDSNRAAFEVCRSVADLKPVSPLPVVILGDQGAGKTHLLYAIVNRIKAGSSKAGLAYVTAQDFPDQVRALIDDPSPVERAESAVLLVDQLDGFVDQLEELEAIIRIFLDNGHYAVLASRVHPERLRQLGDGLAGLLRAGQTVELLPQETETREQVLERRIRQEHEETLAKQREEIRELRVLVERVGQGGVAGGGPELDQLRAQLEEERASQKELAQRLELAKAYSDSVQRDLANLQQEVDRFKQGMAANAGPTEAETQLRRQLEEARAAQAATAREAEGLRQELARVTSAEEEVEQLREALESLQAEKAAAEAKPDTEALQAQLEAARNEGAQARHEANLLLERAEKLLGQIETNRSRFGEVEKQYQARIRDLEALLANSPGGERLAVDLAAARSEARQVQSELAAVRQHSAEERKQLAARLAQTQERLAKELDEARRQAASAMAARDRAVADTTAIVPEQVTEIRAELEKERSARDALQEELGGARSERDGLQNELDTIRAERDALQSGLDEALGGAEALRNELESLRGEQDGLQGEFESLRGEQDALQANMEAIRAERDTLQSELGGAREVQAALEAELDEAQSERDGLRAQIAEGETREAELREKLGEAERDLRSRESDLEALRREAAEQVAAAQAQAGELEGLLARRTEELERAQVKDRDVGEALRMLQEGLKASMEHTGGLVERLVTEEVPGDETETREYRESAPAMPTDEEIAAAVAEAGIGPDTGEAFVAEDDSPEQTVDAPADEGDAPVEETDDAAEDEPLDAPAAQEGDPAIADDPSRDEVGEDEKTVAEAPGFEVESAAGASWELEGAGADEEPVASEEPPPSVPEESEVESVELPPTSVAPLEDLTPLADDETENRE